MIKVQTNSTMKWCFSVNKNNISIIHASTLTNAFFIKEYGMELLADRSISRE